MKRCLLILLALALGSSAWAAPPATLKFWQFWPEEWLAPELAQFEAETGIQVEVERLTWGDGLNKIITALAADQAPDVIELGSTWVAGFSGQGGLLPLEPGELRNRLLLWQPATYQGRVYAVPWTLSTAALYYNKTLLAQIGQPPPQDWNQLKAASEAIHAHNPQHYGFGVKTGAFTTWQKFLPFAWSQGADMFTQGRPRANEPAMVEALVFYRSLLASGLFDDNLAVRKAFQEGRVGFMIEEPGQIEQFRRESPQLEFGVIPLPRHPVTGQAVAFAGAQMLAITKNAQDPASARRLIDFLSRPSVVQAITSRITTLFPAFKGASQLPFYQEQHPELLVFLQALETAHSPEAHPQLMELQEIFSRQVERSLYGLDEPQAALDAAQAEMTQLLQEQRPSGKPLNPLALPWGWMLGGPVLLLCLWLGLGMAQSWRRFPERRPQLLRQWRYHGNSALFLAPWILVFGGFSLFPIGYSLFMSFTDYPAAGSEPPVWVGLGNYLRLWGDEHFRLALKNSLVFVAGTVPPILALALLLAVLLNQKLRYRNFFRAAYFMPVVTSVMVIATLFVELYAPMGLINQALVGLGLAPVHFLRDPRYALSSVMVMNIWSSFGFYAILLLAGLQNIPQEYYEASSLEGAGPWRQFFTITLPLLKPTLLVALVMDVILAFQVFGEILLMTRGGPLRSSETAVYYLYEVAFHQQKMGYGAAAAYYLFLILVAFTLGQFWLSRQKKAKA